MAQTGSWQRGKPDEQALLVRPRASRSIATVLAECVSPRDGLSLIPPGSEYDPRIYVTSNGKAAKKPGRGRLSECAEFLSERTNHVESVSRWRRDLQGWLDAKRSVSPEKLRVFARAVQVSWFRLFWEVGYFQHLVVIIGKLLDEDRTTEAAICSGYTFRDWLPLNSLATLDLFEPFGLFDRALSCIEESLGFWTTVPARIEVGAVKNDSLRCVLRLCDPADSRHMKDGNLRYPCGPAREASMLLLRQMFPDDIDPFDARKLIEMTNTVLSARKKDVEKGDKAE